VRLSTGATRTPPTIAARSQMPKLRLLLPRPSTTKIVVVPPSATVRYSNLDGSALALPPAAASLPQQLKPATPPALPVDPPGIPPPTVSSTCHPRSDAPSGSMESIGFCLYLTRGQDEPLPFGAHSSAAASSAGSTTAASPSPVK
jgi:hypothetical protein